MSYRSELAIQVAAWDARTQRSINQRAGEVLHQTAEYLNAKADRYSGEAADALRQAAEMVAARAVAEESR